MYRWMHGQAPRPAPPLTFQRHLQFGQVKGFDAKPFFTDKKASVRNDRVTLLGVAASKLAVEDAKLDLGGIDGGACVCL